MAQSPDQRHAAGCARKEAAGLCVYCQSREDKRIKGRSARGRMPAEYRLPHPIEVAVQHTNSRIERQLCLALHEAEGIGRTLRSVPYGACLIGPPQPARPIWNSASSRFEFVCPVCDALGLLERVQRGGAD